ncbi:MAG: superfamily I DNA and RNA helicase and helicaseubunit [Thermoprotei archaeon]|nr:MAG: superfamily I DNA and RNA helicase and helicaseubunit [Thermoprotei archaeon]RLE56837.1 MAG: superfamily I DNA and RNA helicase and helicaseubunit [Thermoprotei archaeon]
MEVIYVPRRLIEKAQELGIDINDVVLKALANTLNLDVRELTNARLEIAEKFLEEAKEYIRKRDPVQSSEKLYRAVEECIKVLAEVLKVPQLEEVKKRGRWTTWLLGMASTDLSRVLREERIALTWSKAYEVHVWSLHEARYRVEDVGIAVPVVEWLLTYTR